MDMKGLWSRISHGEKCRVYIANSDEIEVSETRGVFGDPEGEQPVIVIDNTQNEQGGRHATLESPLLPVEDWSEPVIEFETAILEQLPGGVNSATIIVNFLTAEKNTISNFKFSKRISTRVSSRVAQPISIPLNTEFLSVTLFVNSTNKISIAFSGFYIGERRNEEEDSDDRVTVTMFVFNNFSNDTRVLREAKSLIELGLRVRVIAVLSTGQRERENIEGIEVTRLQLTPFHLRLMKRWPSNSFIDRIRRGLVKKIFMPFHRYLMFYEFEKRSVSLLKGKRSEIYHSHDLNTLRTASKLSSLHGSKLVYDSHELYLDRNRSKKAGLLKRGVIKRFEKGLVRKCNVVITVNESIAEILERRYGIEGVSVVMNTPPMQFFSSTTGDYDLRKILNIRDEQKIAIYVGSIQYNRGIENLLRSLQYLEEFHLVLMGYGDERLLQDLDEIAEELNLTERYSKFGPVHPELVPQYTSSADIGVAPILNSCLSYYLCSPNKVFEYMHAGIPVVASDFPELKKVVLGEGIGDVFDPEDPEDIARSLMGIIGNDESANKFKINSINSSRKYNWGIQSKNLQSIYAEMFPGEDFRRNDMKKINVSKIESTLLTSTETSAPWLEVENALPGSSTWGSPKGSESTSIFRAKLNSQMFRVGDSVEVSAVSSRDLQLSGEIYRIGHYGEQGGRKIAHLGECEVPGVTNGVNLISGDYDDGRGTKHWSNLFSIEIDPGYFPGTYVLKIGNSDYNMILPFWIHGDGQVLAIVPTVSNRIHSFPSNSLEKKAIFTLGLEEKEELEIGGNANHSYLNGRGGSVPKWIFPFCRWAEKSNVAISWVTDIELEKTPEISEKFRKIVLLGDSRFWTKTMHGVIGRHISSGGSVANIGCGMGEQLISIEEDGSFKLIINEEEGDSRALCERWSVSGSPTRFGGRTEVAIEINDIEDISGESGFDLIGSWDSRKESLGNYNVRNIQTFVGELPNSTRVEVTSDEIRTHSGSSIFLASMENWSSLLDNGIGHDSGVENSPRIYLNNLISNSIEMEKNVLWTKREAIRALAEREWGAKVVSRKDELRGREQRIPINRVCILSSIWQREDLTSAFLSHLNYLVEKIPEFEFKCVVVGSEGERSKKVVEKFGHHYVEERNNPLSKKWNAGLRKTKEMDPDVVIVLGSDDFLSPSTIRSLCESISEGRLMSGLMDMHILDSKKEKMYHWNGYVMSNPLRKWETIGMARCLSRRLLEKVDFSIWEEEDIDKGLDGLMTRKLAKLGLIPIPFGEEVWLEIEGSLYAFGHSGMYSSEIDGFALDVKSGHNITPIENYRINEFEEVEDYLEVLKNKLGEGLADEIIQVGE